MNTILKLSEKIKNKDLSVKEVLLDSINKINDNNKILNCFISIDEEHALARAEEIQKLVDDGVSQSPIMGVPVALSDNICVKGGFTTCASKMLEQYKSPYNATVVDKLMGAGAIIVGKLNMDEFAMGNTTETSYFGPDKNPWNSEAYSSGGPAAAVASGMVPYALGTDTGGAIRQSCSFCGTTGLKPTYGTVSRFGLIAYASSFDQIGPIAKSAEECKSIVQIIRGIDPKDSTTVDSNYKNQTLKELKIGVLKEFIDGAIDDDVRQVIIHAVKVFEELGAKCEYFSLRTTDYALPAYYIIACAEASLNMSRFDGVKYGYRAKDTADLEDMYLKTRSQGFGWETKKRIMLGSFVLSSENYDLYYKKALKVQSLIKDAFNDAFCKYDLILGPTTPTSAIKLGESVNSSFDLYTVFANLTGLPALTAPCGFDQNGMPIGFQLIGKAYSDEQLLNVAIEYQKVTSFHEEHPKGVKNNAL